MINTGLLYNFNKSASFTLTKYHYQASIEQNDSLRGESKKSKGKKHKNDSDLHENFVNQTTTIKNTADPSNSNIVFHLCK